MYQLSAVSCSAVCATSTPSCQTGHTARHTPMPRSVKYDMLQLPEPVVLLLQTLLLQGANDSLDESLTKETPEEAAKRLKQQSADTRSAVM